MKSKTVLKFTQNRFKETKILRKRQEAVQNRF